MMNSNFIPAGKTEKSRVYGGRGAAGGGKCQARRRTGIRFLEVVFTHLRKWFRLSRTVESSRVRGSGEEPLRSKAQGRRESGERGQFHSALIS